VEVQESISVGGVPPRWCEQGRRQRRGRFGGVPAVWEGFLQDGANRGVDSAEEDGVPAGWEGFLQNDANRGVGSAEEDVEVYLQGGRGSSGMVQTGA
jgi:hypothetical protein